MNSNVNFALKNLAQKRHIAEMGNRNSLLRNNPFQFQKNHKDALDNRNGGPGYNGETFCAYSRNSQYLKDHSKIRSEKLRHQCVGYDDTCDRVIRSAKDLKRYIRGIHSGEKPYESMKLSINYGYCYVLYYLCK